MNNTRKNTFLSLCEAIGNRSLKSIMIMNVIISNLPLGLEVRKLQSKMVNYHGKTCWGGGGGGGGLYFAPYLPSSPKGEPSRKGNFRPLGPLSCAEERAVPGQVAKPELLNEHYYPVHARLRVHIRDSLLALSLFSFHFCVFSSRALGGRVDSVTLTLEEQRVSSHHCVAQQL